MARMLFAAFAMICWALLPSKAEVLTLSCDGIMKEQEQERPHTITKMGLTVNFDAGVVTGFTGITARIDEVSANSGSFRGTTIHPSGTESVRRSGYRPTFRCRECPSMSRDTRGKSDTSRAGDHPVIVDVERNADIVTRTQIGEGERTIRKKGMGRSTNFCN